MPTVKGAAPEVLNPATSQDGALAQLTTVLWRYQQDLLETINARSDRLEEQLNALTLHVAGDCDDPAFLSHEGIGEIPEAMPISPRIPSAPDCDGEDPVEALSGVETASQEAAMRDAASQRSSFASSRRRASDNYWPRRAQSADTADNFTSNEVLTSSLGSERGSNLFEKKGPIGSMDTLIDGGATTSMSVRPHAPSAHFEILCGAVILTHACVIGIETEYLTRNVEPSLFLSVLQQCFNAWYFVEMVYRMYISGLRRWFTSKDDRAWNSFDMLVVALWPIDLFMENMKQVSMTRVIRSFRLFRLLRTLRIFRVARILSVFRKMVWAFTSSLSTLLWSVLLLIFEVYFFAVVFTQGAIQYKNDHEEGEGLFLLESFGTLPRSACSLYLSMSNGVSWGLMFDSILLCSPAWLYGGLFLLYITITLLGVLNVLTAIFVESAMQSTAHDRELLVEANRRNEEVYVRHIKAIFTHIDEDGSGEIELDEIERIFADPSLNQLLQALDITARDAHSMFKLLDRDESGSVDIEEFCDGCLRLKGEAKSYDVNCLLFETKRLLFKLSALLGNVDALGNTMRRYSGKAEENITDMETRLRLHIQDEFRGLRRCGSQRGSKASDSLYQSSGSRGDISKRSSLYSMDASLDGLGGTGSAQASRVSFATASRAEDSHIQICNLGDAYNASIDI